MNFKVGQKVVCVISDKGISKGNIYVILDFDYCACKHKCWVDVGITMPVGKIVVGCGDCSHDLTPNINWWNSRHFTPIEYNSAHDEIMQKFESPIERPDILEPVKPPKIPQHEQ